MYDHLAQQTGNSPDVAMGSELRRLIIVVFVAVESALVLMLFSMMVWEKYFLGLSFDVAMRSIDGFWGGIDTLVLLAGGFALVMCMVAARWNHNAGTVLFLALAVVCGMDSLGVKVIELTRGWYAQFRTDIAGLAGGVEGGAVLLAEETTPAVQTPDPARGSTLFAASCASCHGADGTGLPRLGADLKTSRFVSGLGVDELVSFLKTGRQPSDPQSVMRGVMPPRGGNPTFTDQDLADISAFVKDLNAGTASTTPLPAAAAFTAHQSNIPSPPSGPPGLRPEFIESPISHGLSFSSSSVKSVSGFMKFFTILVGLHALHVSAATIFLIILMIYPLNRPITRNYRRLLADGVMLWQLAAVVWLFQYPLIYWLL